MELQKHFERIRIIIAEGRAKALQAAYKEQLRVYWQVGAYIAERLKSAEWGDKIVAQFSSWLKLQEPTLKGFDRRSIYRMQEFYITWASVNWQDLLPENVNANEIVGSLNPQLESANNQQVIFVGSENPQMPDILGKLSWTHHMELLKRTATIEEKLFYLILTVREKYTVKSLIRQIEASVFERQMLSTQQIDTSNHPASALIPAIFKDRYIFEFLDLQENYSENDLQKGLLKRLKQFLLELGSDFIFMGEEYRLQAGMHDYYIDLLFYHRELQCIVVFELKTTEFQPEYLGKVNFYLEVLDREVKKPHENPSIGVLLCKYQDKEVVEIAMSRNISPTLTAVYETKLIDKQLLKNMLHKWAENMENN